MKLRIHLVLLGLVAVSAPCKGSSEASSLVTQEDNFGQVFHDGAKRLTSIAQKQLRGYKQHEDPVDTLTQVTDVFISEIEHMKAARKLFESSSDEKLLPTLISSYINDVGRAANEIAGAPGMESDSQALDDIPSEVGGDAVAEYLNTAAESTELSSTLFENVAVKKMERAVETLTDIRDMLASRQKQHPRRLARRTGLHQKKQRRAKVGTQGASRYSPYKHGGINLPKMKNIDQVRALGRDKSGGRKLQNQQADQCFSCDVTDIPCNCQILQDCAKQLSWYDVAVLTLGGWIDTDSESETYGDLLSESMDDINVFDARYDLGPKMDRIMALAETATENMDENKCNDLLSELHTACSEESCVNPNIHSFQLSVDEVCQAVDTPAKFRIAPMGGFYDFRSFAFAGRGKPVQKQGDRVVFVTSQGYNGNLGGLQGADAKCQNHANQAGLGGVFKAWLSTQDNSVASRFDRLFDSVRYIRPDGTLILSSWEWLTGSNIQRRIDMDELGNHIGGTSTQVWTGTDSDGSSWSFQNLERFCNSWSSNSNTLYGRVGVIGLDNSGAWSGWSHSLCNEEQRLYCFQQEPIQLKSSLEKKHAVRCCRDHKPEVTDVWYPSPVGAPSCSVTTTQIQMWTGDRDETEYQAPNGYTKYPGRKCEGLATVVEEIEPVDLTDCADLCDEDSECISFQFSTGGICQFFSGTESSTCNHYHNTFPGDATDWYFKHYYIVPTGYEQHSANYGCEIPADDDPWKFQDIPTVQECANLCSMNDECVSFAYSCSGPGCSYDFGYNRCWLSRTCSDLLHTNFQSGTYTFNWFKKKDEFQQDETECLFMPFKEAKEFCRESGGRLCTKNELENGCASFMGCGFDKTFVWSQSEASPEVCEGQSPQKATSYASCDNFVSAMETLYAEKPSDFLSDNPLRIDSNVASGPNFVNVQFPTHFNWVVDAEHHGMAAIDRDVPFLYHYEQDLSVKSFSGGCLDFNGAHYQFIGKDDVFDSAVDDPFQACWDYCGMDAPLPGLVGMTAAVGGDREGRCNCLHEQGMVPDSSLFPGSSSNTARTGTGTVTEGDGNTNWLCYSVEGLFCGAQLGPPTTLAQACDDSMDFLLGSSVSIGMLTSTAKAVQDFDPSLSIGPRWHDWYSSLNDNPLLDFVQTWQSDYAVTKDTRDEPGWLGSYLNVSDEDPHYSPRIQGPIYCKDSSGNRLSLCQGSWLDNPTNPFDHTSLYKGSVLVAPDTLQQAVVGDGMGSTPVVVGRTFTIQGSDTISTVWNQGQNMHYVFAEASGNLDVRIKVHSFQSSNINARAGIVIRTDLTTMSRHYSALIEGITGSQQGRYIMRWGTTQTDNNNPSLSGEFWLRVTKTGNSFRAFYSEDDGVNWPTIGQTRGVDLQTNGFHVGIAVSSGSPDEIATLDASEFTIIQDNNIIVYESFCDFSSCQDDWLGMTSNPFAQGHGCHDFFYDCVEEDPVLYQCQVFWDVCRDHLNSNVPEWATSISVDQNGIMEKQYCNGDRELTCDLDWLVKNPYSPDPDASDKSWVLYGGQNSFKTAPTRTGVGLKNKSDRFQIGCCRSLASFPLEQISVGSASGSAAFDGDTFTISGSHIIAVTFNGGQEMHYAYYETSGNVDVKLKVLNFQSANDGARAGLIVRGNLDVHATHFAALVEGATGNQRGRYSYLEGNTLDDPYNTPSLSGEFWLRITKVDDTFEAFYSTDEDAESWSRLGYTRVVTFPSSTFFVGIGVSSQSTTGLATLTASQFTITSGSTTAVYEEGHWIDTQSASCVDPSLQVLKLEDDIIFDFDVECPSPHTFDEAGLHCSSKGGRLCTYEEVASDCVKDTGCGINSELIWTSTSSDTNLPCYEFAENCRQDLNSSFPEYVHPPKYCKLEGETSIYGDPALSCLEDWIDSEDTLSDSECDSFKTYCQNQLVLAYPRYVFPLPPNPEREDYMPGHCCLDTPTQTDFNDFWGEHYSSTLKAHGMECKNRGEWFMGMSEEVCHNAGGQWFRSPCISLYVCIENRPRQGDPAFNQKFEDFVLDNDIDIYDYTNEEHCETTRAALGYDNDHPNDHDVCNTFNELLCDPFFNDLEFLANVGGGPVKFEQVTYVPIEYPPDAPLFFDRLPPEQDVIRTAVYEEDVDSVISLETAHFYLKEVVIDTWDLFDAMRDQMNAACNKKKDACDAIDTKINALEFKNGLAITKCRMLNAVVAGASLPAESTCLKIANTFFLAILNPLYASKIGCDVSSALFCHVFGDTAKYIAYGLYFGAKIAAKALDIAVYHATYNAAMDEVNFEYTKATHDNVAVQFEWNKKALETVNKNLLEQHIQMRSELQDRHQDVANDVNQFTTCMSNYLGIKIFEALEADTDRLSALCSRLLGVGSSGSRRLEQADPPFNLNVRWSDNSFVSKMEKRDLVTSEKEKYILSELGTIQSALGIVSSSSIKATSTDAPNGAESVSLSRSKGGKLVGFGTDNLFNDEMSTASNGAGEPMDYNPRAKSKLEVMEADIQTVKAKVESKFDIMENKFDIMENKFGTMERKIDALEEMMAQIIVQNKKLLSLASVTSIVETESVEEPPL